jgi:hypothetical protein
VKRYAHQRKGKWPHGPRFTVGSVTGGRIEADAPPSSGGGNRNRPLPTLWYVHDAAYCYRVVLETWKEHEARQLAHRLNEGEETGP